MGLNPRMLVVVLIFFISVISLTVIFLTVVFTYAPDNQWFIRTMNVVFEVGGDLVRKEVAHNLMRLIAEGVTSGLHSQ